MRENGFYWVKMSVLGWIVGVFDGNDRWMLPGFPFYKKDSDFIEIDEEKIVNIKHKDDNFFKD
jgi:hypothetical protein